MSAPHTDDAPVPTAALRGTVPGTPAAPSAISGVGRAFRAVAIAEACSWAGLLIGMFFKYVVVGDEIGVKIFGPIHGALFVLYLVVTIVAARKLRWSPGALVLALACSVPPLATLWFEHRALRRGRLADPAVPATA